MENSTLGSLLLWPFDNAADACCHRATWRAVRAASGSTSPSLTRRDGGSTCKISIFVLLPGGWFHVCSWGWFGRGERAMESDGWLEATLVTASGLRGSMPARAPHGEPEQTGRAAAVWPRRASCPRRVLRQPSWLYGTVRSKNSLAVGYRELYYCTAYLPRWAFHGPQCSLSIEVVLRGLYHEHHRPPFCS